MTAKFPFHRMPPEPASVWYSADSLLTMLGPDFIGSVLADLHEKLAAMVGSDVVTKFEELEASVVQFRGVFGRPSGSTHPEELEAFVVDMEQILLEARARLLAPGAATGTDPGSNVPPASGMA